MSVVWFVLCKELVDGWRDWRSLSSAFVYPLLVPALMLLMMSMGVHRESPEPLRVAIVNAGEAPNLVQYLQNHGVIVEEIDGDPEEAVASGDFETAVVLREDHAERFREGLTAEISIVQDGSRISSIKESSRAILVLGDYRFWLRNQRAVAHGVGGQYALRPVDLARIDISAGGLGAFVLAEVMVMLILVAAFLCNMYTVIDVTAGGSADRWSRCCSPR